MDVANYEATMMNTLKEVESLKEQLISRGAKTWSALESAEPEQTYRVTIEGVTWKQYMQIRENCPLAEAAKETNRW